MITLESCVNEIKYANTPSTMPSNKEQGFIIIPKEIYVYIYFQMVIINDLQVLIFWPNAPKPYMYISKLQMNKVVACCSHKSGQS